MPRYRVPRLTIGPKTTELILDIGRTLNVDDEFESVELHITRRKCGEKPTYIFKSYATCGTEVHFQIPKEFMQAEIDRGFYDVEVYVDDCPVTSMELIKAPSRYIKSGKAVENDCAESDWVEPPCEDETDECNKCGGLTTVPSGCPTCFGTEYTEQIFEVKNEPMKIDTTDYIEEDK